jgi:DNA-3-methyladenine glycosylase II
VSTSHITQHFLKNDKKIHAILVTMDLSLLEPQLDSDQYFLKLTRNIVGQQLSVKVAEVIIKRFEALFNGNAITPQDILKLEDQTLRDIGMSWAKVKYVKDLALKTAEGQLAFDQLPHMDDESVITELTKVKGIGRWTGEMFLMFTLGREDSFSFGDLGLRRAIEKIYQLEKDVSVDQIKPLVKKWKPYRTYAALALWHSLDNKPK